MGFYRKVKQLNDKKRIEEYEEIINKINTFYEKYSKIYSNDFDVTDKVEECFFDGKNSVEKYLKDYLDSKIVDSEFLQLINIISEKKGYEVNGLITNKQSILDRIIKKYSNIKTNDYSFSQKIDYVYNLVINNPNILNDTETKALLLVACGSGVSICKKILFNYKDMINSKVGEGKNIVSAISQVISENNIELNLTEILNEFKNSSYDYLSEKLEKELREKLIINEFISQTNRLRNLVSLEIASGRDKDDVLRSILPDAYGLVKAACEYVLSKKLYDVQLMGGIALNDGNVAEMYTGEGKTLTAILPAFLNSLTGREVDIFSSNDYLASRDAYETSKVFNLLGLTVGCVRTNNQSISEKQKAYNCDIVYGSSTAFAFDFLYDTNMDNQQNLVQRELKPGFVVVDEADQILINNALSPYELQENGRPLSNRQKKENNEVISFLTEAKRLSDILSNSTYTAKNQYEFEIITGDNKEVTKKMENKYSLLIGKTDVVITEKGERELFYNYMYDEIFDLSNKAKQIFIDDKNYVENRDYIVREDHLMLTPDGLEKAIREIDEFQTLNLKWLTDPKAQTLKRYVVNALTAEYLLEKGKNYQVVIDNETGKNIVVVLQDGRILPNSKFMNGIHQALELKENIGVQIEQGESLLDSSLASISNRALLSRYDKVSGMTGTADRTAFYEIYHLDTFEVPKNKEYQYEKGLITEKPLKRKDNPVKLYKDNDHKFNAIVEDIISCYEKEQPVLVVTDNEEDAVKLSQMITIPFNLLTSSNNLEEEAQIVARAGMKSAVTIATEMAGRGTDIKLGGSIEIAREELKNEVFFQQAKREKISRELKKYESSLENRQTIYSDFSSSDELFDAINELIEQKPEVLNEVIDELRKKYNNDIDYRKSVDSIVEQKHELIVENLIRSGGIKYIQVNPFKTTRNDNQGKGRVARQGEPGETIMYSSFEDLVNIGVDRDELNELSRMIEDKDFIDDRNMYGLIGDTIENAQLRNEFNYDLQIASTDTMDFAMSALGLSILKSRKDILSVKDPNIMFDNMIDSVINVLIKRNVPEKKIKKVDKDRTKISRLNLNNDNLYKSVLEIFNIELDSDEIGLSCSKVGDLKDFIYDRVKEKQNEINLGLPKKRVNDKIKKTFIKNVNNVYSNFIYSAENVRLQEMNDMLGQNGSHDRTIELNNIYNECIYDGWIECMTNIFRPNIKKKQKEFKPDLTYSEIPMFELPTIEEIKTR